MGAKNADCLLVRATPVYLISFTQDERVRRVAPVITRESAAKVSCEVLRWVAQTQARFASAINITGGGLLKWKRPSEHPELRFHTLVFLARGPAFAERLAIQVVDAEIERVLRHHADVALRDATADKHDLLRIVDESGEDYLYPKAFFRTIALPLAVKKAVLAA